MDWKAQNNIWSFKASKLSSLPKQLSPLRLPNLKAAAVLLSRRLRIRRSGRQPQAEAENQ